MTGTFLLNRPQVANALDLKTAQQLAKKIQELEKSKSPGLIIASANPGVFCSGGDLKEYSKMKTKQEGLRVNDKIRKILQDFQKSPLIIVAAVEGVCVGGGFELALAADRIVCGENALFAFRQIMLSLSPGWGGAQRLLSRVRLSAAFDWLSSGRQIGAAEALRCGLVDEIVPIGAAQQRAQEFIQERSSIGPELILMLKKLLRTPSQEEKVFKNLWFSPAHRRMLK